MCTKDIHGRVSIDTLGRYSQSTLDQHLIDTQSTLHRHSICISITQFCKCHRVGAFDHLVWYHSLPRRQFKMSNGWQVRGRGWPGDSGVPNDWSISLIQQISKHIFTTVATDLANWLSSQWSKFVVDSLGCVSQVHNILATVMMHIIVNKSANHAKPHLIC